MYTMAYFKKRQLPRNKKWYPAAVTIGRPVDTDTIAKKLAELSSLSTGDVKSVLDLLGGVMGDCMNQGRSVKLDGVGTFYYTIDAEGNGVDTEKEVSAKQINGTRVRFIPEVTRGTNSEVTTRSMVSSDTFWELLDNDIPAQPVPGGTGTGEDDDGLLSFIRSLSLSPDNKEWLAERLVEDARHEQATAPCQYTTEQLQQRLEQSMQSYREGHYCTSDELRKRHAPCE